MLFNLKFFLYVFGSIFFFFFNGYDPVYLESL